MRSMALLCDLSLAPEVALAFTAEDGKLHALRRITCPTREAFDEAVAAYLRDQGAPVLDGAAISARGWEDREGLHLIGVDFSIDRPAMRDLLQVRRVNVINNFVARALAVPRLKRDEKVKICGGEAYDDHALAVLGPHFGLGLAGLVSDGAGGWTALHGEGGHSDVPAKTGREWEILEAIRARIGYVSREAVISMMGLTCLWQALHDMSGQASEALPPAEIMALARNGDARAREAVNLMTDFLAAMASDVALIMGTSSGVYLTGALLDMIGDLFNAERFTRRYFDKGPLSGYVEKIPVFRTRASDMELKGLATLFD